MVTVSARCSGEKATVKWIQGLALAPAAGVAARPEP
jgi:hypothetical protein